MVIKSPAAKVAGPAAIWPARQPSDRRQRSRREAVRPLDAACGIVDEGRLVAQQQQLAKQQQQIEEWAIEGPKRLAERKKVFGEEVPYIKPEDVEDYKLRIAELQTQNQIPEAPAMPVIPVAALQKQFKREQLP